MRVDARHDEPLSTPPGPGSPDTLDLPDQVSLGRVIRLPIPPLETISPELALVDPQLDRIARSRLPEPGAFFPAGGSAVLRVAPPPPVRPAVPEPVVAVPPAVDAASTAVPPAPAAAAVTAGRRSGRRTVAAVAVLLAAGGLLGWGASTLSSGDPENAAAPAPASPPPAAAAPPPPAASSPAPATSPPTTAPGAATPRASTPPAKQKPAAAKPPASRTFAWPPSATAKGYEVQLFRGPDQILVTKTTDARLTLRPTWRFAGRTYHLRPGVYRWYVWALGAGETKIGKPLVQAELTVD